MTRALEVLLIALACSIVTLLYAAHRVRGDQADLIGPDTHSSVALALPLVRNPGISFTLVRLALFITSGGSLGKTGKTGSHW